MKASELTKFRNTLEAKQAELVQTIRNRGGMAIEKSPDALDEAQHASERELAIHTLDRESTVLRETRMALQRITEETFGTCTDCENDISPRRLAAVPWTPRCIDCQEVEDRLSKNGGLTVAMAT